MPSRHVAWLILGILAAFLVPFASSATLRVTGSTTVNPVIVEAASLLAQSNGPSFQLDTLGGSSGGIAALADGRADVAMSSRPILASDRTKYLGAEFQLHPIALDAVALVVSRDVWDGGIRALSRNQVRQIYEGTITNWKMLGGPDRAIVFFNKEPGRGTWEVFARWLYGDSAAAPLVSLLEVGSNEEARNKVAATRGAITQLSAAWADGNKTMALALRDPDGGFVEPSAHNVRSGDYPVRRYLYLITDGAPSPEVQALLDFILSPPGQAIVERHGFQALASPRSIGVDP